MPTQPVPTLKMLPKAAYPSPEESDPLYYYYIPLFGKLYRKRVELCLGECHGGERILEVGYGSGVTFINLHDEYDEIHGIDLDADPTQVSAVFARRGIPVHLKQGNLLNLDYPDGWFDTILLISILEHLKPEELTQAFGEIKRTLKPGGQVVYGVPVERPLMVFMFRLLGVDIRTHHFSTHTDISQAAGRYFTRKKLIPMTTALGLSGAVYEVGHFTKNYE